MILIDFLSNIPSIKVLLDSDASLNLIHEKLVTALSLLIQLCVFMYIMIIDKAWQPHSYPAFSTKRRNKVYTALPSLGARPYGPVSRLTVLPLGSLHLNMGRHHHISKTNMMRVRY